MHCRGVAVSEALIVPLAIVNALATRLITQSLRAMDGLEQKQILMKYMFDGLS